MTGLPHVQARPRKKRNIFENLFFVLLLLTTGFVLLNSPLFEVKRIEVSGNRYLDAGAIRAAANIGMGTNIFKVNLNAVAGDIKVIPMVKEVRVRRVLPASILVEISEREPLGLFPTAEGFIEIDAEGVYLKKASAGAEGLPVVTGVRAAAPNPGEPVQGENLREALQVIGGLAPEVVKELSEVHVGAGGQVVLYTLDRIQCRFGAATEIAEKSRVLTQVLKEIRNQGAKIQYIDLSCAGSPVVYYKKAGKGGTR
ncbi:MAG: FtsQ-type POTRA domain-containing protein [Firmicutes bacterium]|nr:FtsQ-type POTRA domain-containing protein [Bacillota bacterium]